MPVQWYYQNREGDVGPVSVAELKYLINVGTIRRRRWCEAVTRITGSLRWRSRVYLKRTVVPRTRTNPARRFRSGISISKARKSRGPSRGASSRRRSLEGKLQSDDLVWKPGMALWVPASQVRGLLAESSYATVRGASRLTAGAACQSAVAASGPA